MALRVPPSVLVLALAAAAALAVYGSSRSSSASAPIAMQTPAPMISDDAPPFDDTTAPSLPPNHPAIGASPHGAASHPAAQPPSDERPAIAWTPPKAWETRPNPTSMRLATYRPPHAPSEASESAEVTVSRAGGDVEANIQRWLAQFDAAGLEKRSTKNVHGLTITIVEVTGTYQGNAMTPDTAANAQAPGKWTLVGAIVPTGGSSYFFKLLGPAPAVKSARAAFDAMLDGITPL